MFDCQRGLSCGRSSPLVIKTIRLRRPGLLPWLLDTEVRVVHLVRDPRAVITSVAKVTNESSYMSRLTNQGPHSRMTTNERFLFSEARHLERDSEECELPVQEDGGGQQAGG